MTKRISLLICLFAQAVAAQSGALHVLASNGMKAVIEELQPRCERAIGHPLAIQYGSTVGLRQKIDAGETFDVVILTTDAIGDLVKENKATAGTRADFARCGVGVAVRTGAPKPDISTPAALKRTLQAAKSITYA
jgi:molybdate transport system substrate-binding protein